MKNEAWEVGSIYALKTKQENGILMQTFIKSSENFEKNKTKLRNQKSEQNFWSSVVLNLLKAMTH